MIFVTAWLRCSEKKDFVHEACPRRITGGGGRLIKSGLLSVVSCWIVLMASGCATVISKPFQERVGASVPFEYLLRNPEAYEGRSVILGGYILETTTGPDESALTILETPLDFRLEPKGKDLSEGRFLIRSRKFLDPAIYSKDRKVTVGGVVTGTRQEKLGDATYDYPVIEAEELYIWPKEVVYQGPYHPYYWDYPYYWHWWGPWRPYPYHYHYW
jgi:outer membrane lipoprotein